MMEVNTMKCSEITSELFYAIKHSGIPAYEVVSTPNYTDVIYIVHGVKLIARTQNGYSNYYVVDINC